MRALPAILVLALSVAAPALPADADGRRGDGRFHASRGSGGRHHHHHGHHGHRAFPHRPFFPVFVSPSVVVSSPVVVVAPQPVYAPPPVYAPAPFYAQGPAYAAPPPSRVVEFPTGRYELRGDGVTTPYQWVWIPNPTAAPPPPPTAPPAVAPEPTAARRVPAPPTTLYRWTSEEGVTTWTDSLEKVPPRFRVQASQAALRQ